MTESAQNYVPVRCWKCGNITNQAESRACVHCGVFLSSSLSGGSFRRQGRSERRLARLLLWSGAVCLILGGAVFALKTLRQEPPKADGAVIPAESWFQPSLLNLYRQHPTVGEVVAKNASVSGSMSQEQIQSTVLTGKVALAVGDCVNEECRNSSYKIDVMRKGLLVATGKLDPDRTKNAVEQAMLMQHYSMAPKKEPNEITLSDKWTQQYSEVGEMTLRTKRPNRASAEVNILDPARLGTRTVTAEGYNGQNAWKQEKTLDAGGNVIETVNSELDEKGIEDLRQRTLEIWAKRFGPAVKYDGIAKLNDQVCYVLTETDGPALSRDRLYFDSVSGHLVKTDTEGVSIYFTDYRMESGVAIPGNVYYRRFEVGGFHSWTRLKVGEWKFNVDLDDKLFDPPAAAVAE